MWPWLHSGAEIISPWLMWTPLGTPSWHVQMSFGRVRHQLWAAYRDLRYCAAPFSSGTKHPLSTFTPPSLSSLKLVSRPQLKQQWNVTWGRSMPDCFVPLTVQRALIHPHFNLCGCVAQMLATPQGLNTGRKEPSCSRNATKTTPISITINSAQWNSHCTLAPIWQSLVGEGRTGNPLTPRYR